MRGWGGVGWGVGAVVFCPFLVTQHPTAADPSNRYLTVLPFSCIGLDRNFLHAHITSLRV